MEIQTTFFGIAIVPLIIGIIQVVKNGLSDKKQEKYLGLVALVLGIVVGVIYGLTEAHWGLFQSAIFGASLGLSASGGWSSAKNVINK